MALQCVASVLSRCVHCTSAQNISLLTLFLTITTGAHHSDKCPPFFLSVSMNSVGDKCLPPPRLSV